jgi:hypothetical protein
MQTDHRPGREFLADASVDCKRMPVALSSSGSELDEIGLRCLALRLGPDSSGIRDACAIRSRFLGHSGSRSKRESHADKSRQKNGAPMSHWNPATLDHRQTAALDGQL